MKQIRTGFQALRWWLVILIVLVACAVPHPTSERLPEAEVGDQSADPRQRLAIAQLPLSFVANAGQLDPRVKYYIQGSDKTLYFTNEGLTIALTQPALINSNEGSAREQANSSSPSQPMPTQRYVVKLDFIKANLFAHPIGVESTSATISYFKGKPEQWRAGIQTYSQIVYHDLWPGIDLVYNGTVDRLKYEMVVHPGADPRQIQLAYRGATNLSINTNGQLVVTTPAGTFSDDTPHAYQEIDGQQVEVAMAYSVVDDPAANFMINTFAHADPAVHQDTLANPPQGYPQRSYSFRLGAYDPTQPLVLDPALIVYAGFIGGSGDDYVFTGRSLAVDSASNTYVTGYTNSSESSFPDTVGPDLSFNGGTWDAFVAKVNPSGTALIYTGYIGGTGDEQGLSIAVDSAGNAYVAGRTNSDQSTFPVNVGPDLVYGGGIWDGFVAKLNPSGSTLLYAGYIGGDDGDEVKAIAVNANENAFISGVTASTQATFPVLVGPDLTYNGGTWDGFVAKVKADGSGLDYAGYVGGSVDDYMGSAALDSGDNLYVAGHTASNDGSFPVLVGPDLTHNGGGYDGFAAKVKADGTALLYSGFIGGSAGNDFCTDIVVNSTGNAYVVGVTSSDQSSFPVLGGPDLTYNGGLYDAFVSELKADGSGFVYSGYIGGANTDQAFGIDLDAEANVYIAGETDSTESSFPVQSGPDLTYNGGANDGFIGKVNATGTALSYLGYIGGAGDDRSRGVAVDGDGNVHLDGYTNSTETTFPVTTGPDLVANGNYDVFVAKISNSFQPDWMASGENSGTFGYAVSTAGDVNADGYADVLIGADTYSSNRGRVYLYLGSHDGLSANPVMSYTGQNSGDWLGVSVATAGDINADGYSDVIIGAHGSATNIGRAYIYMGGAGGLNAAPALTLTGEYIQDNFGTSVSTIGDVNGDGYSDIIIGAQGYPDNVLQGRAYVYTGSAAGLNPTPVLTLTGEAANDYFGNIVSTAGDVNGDGYSDFLVGAYRNSSNKGRAYLYLGGVGSLNSSPVVTLTGENATDYFGGALMTAGDVNGDGYSDIIVASYGYPAFNRQGRAYVYMGMPSGLSTTPSITLTGENNGDQFGIRVATGGDINGDGYADILVGADGYLTNTGRVYVYFGKTGGLSATSSLTLTGQNTFNYFSRVATAGDVNGDGYVDILVGAHAVNRVYAYYGTSDYHISQLLEDGYTWEDFLQGWDSGLSPKLQRQSFSVPVNSTVKSFSVKLCPSAGGDNSGDITAELWWGSTPDTIEAVSVNSVAVASLVCGQIYIFHFDPSASVHPDWTYYLVLRSSSTNGNSQPYLLSYSSGPVGSGRYSTIAWFDKNRTDYYDITYTPFLTSPIRVTTTVDEFTIDTQCSLREAIRAANLNVPIGGCSPGNGADTIIVPPGIYSLTLAGANEDAGLTGDLDITGDLTIIGSNFASVLIDGNLLDHVLDIRSNANVTLTGITVQHGYSGSSNGGGILVNGNLVLTNTVVYSNSAPSSYGGGISIASGSVLLLSGQIISNIAGAGAGVCVCGPTSVFTQTGGTVERNASKGSGGGIYIDQGRATLSGGQIMSNTIHGFGAGGGGVSDNGTFSMSGGEIRGNTGDDINWGGGVQVNSSGIFTLTGGSILNNLTYDGGGVFMNSGALFMQTGGIIQGNIEGVRVDGGSAILSGGQIISNSGIGLVVGSIYGGQVVLTNELILNNSGGGINNGGTLNIIDSTIAGNQAPQSGSFQSSGGGIFNFGTLAITNSTIANNQAAYSGGGIYQDSGSTYLQNVTIANNRATSGDGGGIFITTGSVSLHNTLVAGNTDTLGNNTPDISGTIASAGYNLIGQNNGAQGLVITDISGTIAVPLNPVLGPFDGQTLPLFFGSPAIDAGDNSNCPGTDQRGVARPQGAACDIGAYEFVTSAPLLAYWKMEEGNGSGAVDSSGNGYDQHLVSPPATPAWSTDVPPLVETNTHSLVFDGGDDYAYSFNITQTSGQSQLTVEAWVKFDGQLGNTFISGAQPGATQWLLGTTSTGELRVILFDVPDWGCCSSEPGAQTDGANLQLHQWYHVALVINTDAVSSTDQIQFYLNGIRLPVNMGSTPVPVTLLNVQPVIELGRSSVVNAALSPFMGKLDEVRIYTVARSSTDIASDANGQTALTQPTPTPPAPPSPVPGLPSVYWKMEDGSGSDVIDSSGNGYTQHFATPPAAPVWSGDAPALLEVNLSSLVFDGVDDYAYSGNITQTAGQTKLTIEGWVKFAGQLGNTFISAAQPSATQWLLGTTATGELRVIIFNVPDWGCCSSQPGGQTIGANIQIDQWYHVAFIYDATAPNSLDRIQLYLNGVRLPVIFGPTPIPTALLNVQPVIELGRSSATNAALSAFAGKLDEVRIYTVARSSTDIANDANGHSGLETVLSTAMITGPVIGSVSIPYVFTAIVSPISVTLPLTYVWQATGQSPVTHTGNLVTNTVSFTWSITGSKSITLIVSNISNTVTATHPITINTPIVINPIANLDIAGSATGLINTTQIFTATASPITVTTPLTYVWQATGQSPATHTGSLVTDTISFTWSATGVNAITLTVSNISNTLMATHRITISAPVVNPITSLTLSGPLTGTLNATYLFTTTASPVTATTPITYLWQAVGQSPITQVSGLSDIFSFIWSTTGTKAITVTAANASSAISMTRWITITSVAGDAYEPNNTCAQAKSIPTDGTVQAHTFHQQADQDWVKFSATSGITYFIEAQIPVTSAADVVLELYNQCNSLPQTSQDYTFSPGARLEFKALLSGNIFLRLVNHSPTVYGPSVTYHLSVRALSNTLNLGAVVIVAGRLNNADPLQSNIHHVTNAIYQLFATHGYTASRIYYLATDPSLPGFDALATADHLQAAITTWALDKVGPNQPFTLFMMDHGAYDRIYLDKLSNEWVTPDQLDDWLTQLETARLGVKINIITEACYSGSFIDLPKKVGGSGRVVIASTGATNLAWASPNGAIFSDHFIDALQQGESLYAGFQAARWAVQAAEPYQTPWLDDNGNGIPNEQTDGLEAQQRGFNFAGTLADDEWPPYIVQASGPISLSHNQGVIQAKVLDDQSVSQVWAVIYPPSYQPPTTGEEIVSEPLSTIVLLNRGGGWYDSTYVGFTETGLYRVVVYATDNTGLQAQPVSLDVRNGWKVFLPAVLKVH
jgi:CSLREA domain-containing protein